MMKYLVEINERQYHSFIDDDNEYVYCSMTDLDGKIFEIIDSEDITSWIPIGCKEFINKFNENFLKND